MKIKFKHGDTSLELERDPMPPERFKIVCAVLLAVLYVVVAIAAVAMIGVECFIILIPVTAAFAFAVCWVLGVSL